VPPATAAECGHAGGGALAREVEGGLSDRPGTVTVTRTPAARCYCVIPVPGPPRGGRCSAVKAPDGPGGATGVTVAVPSGWAGWAQPHRYRDVRVSRGHYCHYIRNFFKLPATGAEGS
jgi:hypothetical protein